MRRCVLIATTTLASLPLFAAAANAQPASAQSTSQGTLSALSDAMNSGASSTVWQLNCANDQRQMLTTRSVTAIQSSITQASQMYRTIVAANNWVNGTTQNITVTQILKINAYVTTQKSLTLSKQNGSWCVAGEGPLALYAAKGGGRSDNASGRGKGNNNNGYGIGYGSTD